MAAKRTRRKTAPKRRCGTRRKLTIAERAKKHGVTVAVFKTYLAQRKKLGQQLLAGSGRASKRGGKSQLSLWSE